jgi:hypothetical protein
MKQVLKTICKAAFVVCFACPPVCAQDVQSLPEVDAYLKLNPAWRAYLQAKDDRDGVLKRFAPWSYPTVMFR